MRAAFRSPHESATDHEGEPAFRIAAVKILLDHLPPVKPFKNLIVEGIILPFKNLTQAERD
jgi:hypothetical protein